MEPIFDVLVLVRWLHFGAMFVLFGGALFWAYVPDDAGVTSSRSFTLRCLRTAAPVALVTGAGWLAATIANMTGGIDGLGDLDTLHAFFLETIFGPIEAARMALLAGIAVLVYVPMRDRFRLVATAAASGLLLVSQAWLGHAAEGGDTLLGATMIVAYAVHVLAAAAWLGGLPPLLARMATLRTRAPPAAILRLLSRFSGMATDRRLLDPGDRRCERGVPRCRAPRRSFADALRRRADGQGRAGRPHARLLGLQSLSCDAAPSSACAGRRTGNRSRGNEHRMRDRPRRPGPCGSGCSRHHAPARRMTASERVGCDRRRCDGPRGPGRPRLYLVPRRWRDCSR